LVPLSWVCCLENIKAEAASRGVRAASPIRDRSAREGRKAEVGEWCADRLQAVKWRNVAVTEGSLTQCIADIRRAVGDDDRRVSK
jgi:hypothetical protein